MLTADQMNKRKAARRTIERKRSDLEEAVERAVCERVYMKLWHHKSTDDEQLDQKLRSRIAALNLIGVGLKELLVSGSDDVSDSMRQKTIDQKDSIREALEPARHSLMLMSAETYPLGKLHHLTTAHKSIVETLAAYFPSSSSADEVLPTLIYTLITSSPEAVNVVSDLHFIQRFRSQSKLTGEAAYCLVNLEAAICFLETADLNSLQTGDLVHAPTPLRAGQEVTPMDLGIRAASPPSAQLEDFSSYQSLDAGVRTPVKGHASARSPRRLSQIIHYQTTRLEQASDSLRGAVLDSADSAVGALENSMRFLFGRVRATAQNAAPNAPPAPKTLEDAAKLVATPPLAPKGIEGDENLPASPGTESANGSVVGRNRSESDTRRGILDLVGGRRLRDGSVDSSRSGTSLQSKRVSLLQSASDDNLKGLGLAIPETDIPETNGTINGNTSGAELNAASGTPPATAGVPALGAGPLAAAAVGVESMRNMASNLNPLNTFAKMSLFSRTISPAPGPTSAPSSSGPTSLSTALASTSSKPLPATPVGGVVSPLLSPSAAVPIPKELTETEKKALKAVADVKRAEVKLARKFVDCRDAKELRVGEVEELLAEYKKLALVLGKVLS
jgi:hypothetical protein